MVAQRLGRRALGEHVLGVVQPAVGARDHLGVVAGHGAGGRRAGRRAVIPPAGAWRSVPENAGGSPNTPLLTPFSACTPALRSGRLSVAHLFRPVKKPQPCDRLGNAASRWFSNAGGRTPNTNASAGTSKKTSAQISAVRWRPPCRGRCSGCSLGSSDSWMGGSPACGAGARRRAPTWSRRQANEPDSTRSGQFVRQPGGGRGRLNRCHRIDWFASPLPEWRKPGRGDGAQAGHEPPEGPPCR